VANRLFIFGGLGHDSQAILTSVQRLTFVGIELCRNIIARELSTTSLAHASRGVLLHDHQLPLRHTLQSSRRAGVRPVDFKWHHYQDFPENADARSGDVVRIVVTDHQDRRPVEDILCTDESYRMLHREAGLEAVQVLEPLAKGDETYSWVSETNIAPWVIYVLRRAT